MIDTSQKEYLDIAKAELAEFMKLDERRKQDMVNFCPDVRIIKYPAGEFLVYEDIKILRTTIAEIDGYAQGPNIDRIGYAIARDDRSTIVIRLKSGRHFEIRSNQWNVDILLSKLRDVWIEGKADV